MKALRSIGAEILGLFVDDWMFAGAIAAWVALVALASRSSGDTALWPAPLLFAGLCVVLLASVYNASKRR